MPLTYLLGAVVDCRISVFTLRGHLLFTLRPQVTDNSGLLPLRDRRVRPLHKLKQNKNIWFLRTSGKCFYLCKRSCGAESENL